MKKYVFLLLLAAFLTVFHSFAQDTSVKPYELTQKKFTFAVQPLQIFNWCLRHDIDMRIGKGPINLQFGPALYYSLIGGSKNKPNYFYYDGNEYYHSDFIFDWFREPFSDLLGGGMDINCKLFIDKRRSHYFSAGISYTRLNIKYWGKGWHDYFEDGLLYHEYAPDYYNQQINRLGFNAYFGYQIPQRNAFHLDLFWGLAYRRSYSEKDKPSFNRGMISYGYTGVIFQTGVRIGFGLK